MYYLFDLVCILFLLIVLILGICLASFIWTGNPFYGKLVIVALVLTGLSLVAVYRTPIR